MAKDEGGAKPINPFYPVIALFVIAVVLSAILMRIENFLARHTLLSDFFHTLWLFLQGEATFAQLVGSTNSPGLAAGIFVFRAIAFVFSVFMVWAIFYVYKKYAEANKKLRAPLYPPKEIFYGVEAAPTQVNPKWAKVLAHVNSPNPSDWRLAILEADIMLNEMLDKVGYHGSTMGDKLKSVDPLDFKTLQDAWEAHKVRNAIAHEGSDLVMNKPEAERVIKLFEKVFKEFKFI